LSNMSTSKNPSRSGNQDDPWEQLAEDLFGLEYGKEHAAGEPGRSSVEPESSPAAEAVPPQSEAPAERGYESRAAAAEPPRFASEAIPPDVLTFGETDESADSADVTPADDDAVSESTGPHPAEATPSSPQDSYWDALANWNW